MPTRFAILLALLAVTGCSIAQKPVNVLGTSAEGIILQTPGGLVHGYRFKYDKRD